jgi:trehalose 6-phosphate synthase/phosphatase
MERVVQRTDGAVLEVKSGALAFHYRATEPQLARRRVEELRLALRSDPQAGEYEVIEGMRVFEVRPRGINRGALLPELVDKAPGSSVLAFGADQTDESLFSTLPPGAVGVHVGGGQTVARYRINSVAAVRALLKRIADTVFAAPTTLER